jgi:hypothetical protein
MAEERARLPQPYEILELADLQSVSLHVEGWEIGYMLIKPRYPGAPSEKEILALRLKVSAKDKPYGLPVWDITAQTLVAQLRPMLERRMYEGKILKITAHGEGPKKRFTVEIA